MRFISFQKLGENRQSPRLWLESRRLTALGFTAGTPFSVTRKENGIQLRPATIANNHVSKRIAANRERPIIDVANRVLLDPLVDFSEIKATAAYRQIDIVPSIRGFYIQRNLRRKPPFKTIEVFCGGGTLSAAIAKNRDFDLIAGIEAVPKYADVWQQAHPAAILYQADFRH